MYRIIRMGFVVFAVLALVAPLAFAQDTVALGKKGEVEFTRDTRVGSTLLKPGHYQFQHQSIDGQHFLVVRSQRTVQNRPAGRHYAGATGDEVARVACRLVAADKKQALTALYLVNEADGNTRVTRINIRGEKEGHIITLEPQA